MADQPPTPPAPKRAPRQPEERRTRRHPPSVPQELLADFESIPKWLWIELYLYDVRMRVPNASIEEILHFAQLRAKDIAKQR